MNRHTSEHTHESVMDILLAANELSLGPLPVVKEAIASAEETLHRYPDLEYRELRNALAGLLATSADRIVVANGSSAILRDLIGMLVWGEDEAIYPDPSFAYYRTAIAVAGARGVPVPLSEHRIDLGAMAAAITPRTKVILLCNPNNPTGTMLWESELDEFLGAVTDDVVVVIDEAYQEFVTRVDAPDSIQLAEKYHNVVVTRTFSKAYGLAALRCGYGFLPTELASRLRVTTVPFGVSTFAQHAAVASLAPVAQDQLLARVSVVLSERERLFDGLRRMAFDPVKSEANFLFIPTKEVDELVGELREHGIAVYPVRGHGVRMTVGTKAENDRLREELERSRPPRAAG